MLDPTHPGNAHGTDGVQAYGGSYSSVTYSGNKVGGGIMEHFTKVEPFPSIDRTHAIGMQLLTVNLRTYRYATRGQRSQPLNV